MNTDSQEQYEETISCYGSKDEGLVFIKVVAMPYGDHVEFNTADARNFANKILAAVQEAESCWLSGPTERGSAA